MMTMRKRVLPLGMAIFLLLTALFPVWAIAEGKATPAEVPMESVSPYRILLTAPGGWTSGKEAVMKVSITDKDKLGWQKIEDERRQLGGLRKPVCRWPCRADAP